MVLPLHLHLILELVDLLSASHVVLVWVELHKKTKMVLCHLTILVFHRIVHLVFPILFLSSPK